MSAAFLPPVLERLDGQEERITKSEQLKAAGLEPLVVHLPGWALEEIEYSSRFNDKYTLRYRTDSNDLLDDS